MSVYFFEKFDKKFTLKFYIPGFKVFK